MSKPEPKTNVVDLPQSDSLLAKLLRARRAFRERNIQMSGWNDFSKYMYFTPADIIVPSVECLEAEGLITTPITTDGVLFHMAVIDVETAEAMDIHIPVSSARLKASHEVQCLGAVLTYTRKYFHMAIQEACETDLLDSGATGEPRPKATDQATEAQMDYLRELIDQNEDSADITAKLEAALEKGPLNVAKAGAWIDRLKIRLAEQKKQGGDS